MPPYLWEFTEDDRDFSVAVRSRVLTNDPALDIRLARAGAGLTLADDRVRDDVASGELVPIFEKGSTPFAGFYLYDPQRRKRRPRCAHWSTTCAARCGGSALAH